MYISLIHSHIPNDPLVSLRSHAQGKQSHTLSQCRCWGKCTFRSGQHAHLNNNANVREVLTTSRNRVKKITWCTRLFLSAWFGQENGIPPTHLPKEASSNGSRATGTDSQRGTSTTCQRYYICKGNSIVFLF